MKQVSIPFTGFTFGARVDDHVVVQRVESDGRIAAKDTNFWMLPLKHRQNVDGLPAEYKFGKVSRY